MKVHFLGEHAKRMTYSGQQICFIAHKCNLRPESKLILPAVKKAIVKWSIIFRTSIPCKRLVEVISDCHEYQSAGIFEQQTSILPFPTFLRVAPQWCWRSSCPLRRTRPALWRWTNIKTLPKAQRTRGLGSSFQSNLLGHITSSNPNLD